MYKNGTSNAKAIIVVHAKKRAEERYGVKLNRKDYGELVNRIRKGEGKLIEISSNTRHVVEIEGMYVVYSTKTKKIITFLPKDCRESVKN